MNGYKCFYKGKSIDVYAQTSYEAQADAAVLLRIGAMLMCTCVSVTWENRDFTR